MHLVSRGACTLKAPASAEGTWPVSWNLEPDAPDSVVTVFDTPGRLFGRVLGGAKEEHFGFQVRVRARTDDAGAEKMDQIVALLDEGTYRALVEIEDRNYLVHSCDRVNPVYRAGKVGPTRMNVFTVNYVAAVRETRELGFVGGYDYGYPVAGGSHILSLHAPEE